MIAEFEDEAAPGYTEVPYRIYGLSMAHKHVPEMRLHAGLALRPLFAPAVGRYAQGMIVEVPLQLKALPGKPGARRPPRRPCPAPTAASGSSRWPRSARPRR